VPRHIVGTVTHTLDVYTKTLVDVGLGWVLLLRPHRRVGAAGQHLLERVHLSMNNWTEFRVDGRLHRALHRRGEQVHARQELRSQVPQNRS
jgi:hypothetical protein